MGTGKGIFTLFQFIYEMADFPVLQMIVSFYGTLAGSHNDLLQSRQLGQLGTVSQTICKILQKTIRLIQFHEHRDLFYNIGFGPKLLNEKAHLQKRVSPFFLTLSSTAGYIQHHGNQKGLPVFFLPFILRCQLFTVYGDYEYIPGCT